MTENKNETCGCGCGHDHEHEHEELETIILEFDEGKKAECEIIGVFEHDGREYMGLIDEEDQVYIFRYTEISEEDFDLSDIEDEAEFNAAAKTLQDLLSE